MRDSRLGEVSTAQKITQLAGEKRMEFKQGGSGSKGQALTLILQRPGSLRILGTTVSSPSKGRAAYAHYHV